MNDFHESWYEHDVIGGHPQLCIFQLPQSVMIKYGRYMNL